MFDLQIWIRQNDIRYRRSRFDVQVLRGQHEINCPEKVTLTLAWEGACKLANRDFNVGQRLVEKWLKERSFPRINKKILIKKNSLQNQNKSLLTYFYDEKPPILRHKVRADSAEICLKFRRKISNLISVSTRIKKPKQILVNGDPG